MANNIGLGANPLSVDTAATIVTAPRQIFVQMMQWIDDSSATGGAIVIGDSLILTMNGTTIRVDNLASGSTRTPTVWEASFKVPIRVDDLRVTTIEGGTLLIWRA